VKTAIVCSVKGNIAPLTLVFNWDSQIVGCTEKPLNLKFFLPKRPSYWVWTQKPLVICGHISTSQIPWRIAYVISSYSTVISTALLFEPSAQYFRLPKGIDLNNCKMNVNFLCQFSLDFNLKIMQTMVFERPNCWWVARTGSCNIIRNRSIFSTN